MESEKYCIEFYHVKNNFGANISRVFEDDWFHCYLNIYILLQDNGTELTGLEYKSLLKKYGIGPNNTTIKTQ